MGKWDMVRLGDVCEIVSGTTPSTTKPELWDGDIKWVMPAEISNDSYFIYDTERHISEKAGLKPMPAGTVLLSSRAPIGKVAIAAEPMCCNQGFKNLICSDRIHNSYLYRFLKNQTAYLNSLGRGATFKEISKGIVEDVQIPLPPLPIQQKIADILDRANTLIEKRKTQIEKLDLLVKAQFVEMFGDPVTNPMGWEVCSLNELGVWGSGGTPPRTSPKYFNGDINWYSAGELNEFMLKGSVEKISADAITQTSAKMFPANSLFVGMYDTAAFKLSITPIAASANQACANIFTYAEKANVYWLYFNFQIMKPYFLKQRRGIRQQNLNLGMIKSFQTPLPPLAFQTQFAAFVEHVEVQKARMRQGLELMELEYRALVQKCFRGEIFNEKI